MFEPETFRTFEDHQESPFYRSGDLSPQETWAEIYDALRHCIAGVVYSAQRLDLDFVPETLRAIHHEIFGSTFPADAGRFRDRDAHGEPEHVHFAIEVGTVTTSTTRTVQGAHPDRLGEQLERAFAEFRTRLARLEEAEAVSLDEAAVVPASLYAKLLRIHPFVDGNLRAAYAMLMGALVRMGLPMVVMPHGEHDEAVSRALRTDRHQSYVPLARLLVTAIREAT